MKNISKKHLITSTISIIIILIVGFCIYSYNKKETAVKVSDITDSETENIQSPQKQVLSDDDVKLYLSNLKTPYIKKLRMVFNKYYSGDTLANVVEERLIVDSSSLDDNTKCGFKSFDRKYFNSKFVITDISENPLGGLIVQILFLDKPDRLFNAWVYQMPNMWDLRSFCEDSNKLTVEDIDKYILKPWNEYFSDPRFSI